MTWIKRQITRLAWWWINRYDDHTYTDGKPVTMQPVTFTVGEPIHFDYDKSYPLYDGKPFFVDEPKPKRKKGKAKQ